MKMIGFMRWFVLTQVLMLSIEAQSTEELGISFEDCGSLYDIVKLTVGSCNRTPCFMPLRRRVKISTELEFMGHSVSSSLKHEVKWILNHVHTKAHTRPEVCDRCLYRTQTGYGFQADVFVPPTLQNVRGTMEWVSLNAHGIIVVCFRVPIVFGLPISDRNV